MVHHVDIGHVFTCGRRYTHHYTYCWAPAAPAAIHRAGLKSISNPATLGRQMLRTEQMQRGHTELQATMKSRTMLRKNTV